MSGATSALAEPLPPHYLTGFMLLGVLAGTSNGVAKVVLPLYAATLHATPWQIGLVGGLQFVGMLLLSLPLGALIDRIGSRPLFRLGCLGAVLLFLAGFSYAATPWQLIGCVLLFGVVNPFRMVTTQTEFLHLLPRIGASRAGWQRASQSCGMFFVGPLLGAWLVGVAGYAHTFRSVAAGLFVTLLIGQRVLSTAPPGQGAEGLGLLAHLRDQLRVVISRADLRRTMQVEFLGQVAMSYFTVFVILVAMRRFGMSTQQAAGLVTLQGAAFVLTLLAAGGVIAGWREAVRYRVALVLLLAAELLLANPFGPAALWTGALLLGLGLGLQHLTSVARFARLAQELGRGRTGGMFSLAGPSGGLVGAVAGGLLNQHFGMLAGFHVLALVFLVQLGWQWPRGRAAR
ncbi:MFS transporter [[Empedobacter] haloabium]|uniref:MFS transporter n=1 Tax=[Empedobacter] haloabium TaxID=592317 RepID=A0ABZ1UM91_9BURK